MINNWLSRYNIFLGQEYFLLLLLLIPLYFLLKYRFNSDSNNYWLYSAPILSKKASKDSSFWHKIAPKIMNGIRWTAIVMIIIALARPQATNTEIIKTQEGIDIMIALDVSGSMYAEDFTPNRLDAAKLISEEFINNRYGDRIGLVVFSGESFSQCPLTLDHRVLIELLRRANNQFLEAGTNIGNGIASSINGLKNSKGTSKVIILMTDGYEQVNSNLHISPELAVDMANEFGIKIYTIGVGTQGKAMMPVNVNGSIHKELVDVMIDEATLQMIAEKTQAKYYRATDNQSLQNIYTEINSLEKSTAEFQAFTQYKDLLHIFLMIAFFLTIIEVFMRYSLFKSITN